MTKQEAIQTLVEIMDKHIERPDISAEESDEQLIKAAEEIIRIFPQILAFIVHAKNYVLDEYREEFGKDIRICILEVKK